MVAVLRRTGAPVVAIASFSQEIDRAQAELIAVLIDPTRQALNLYREAM
jgi:hypothetical protein